MPNIKTLSALKTELINNPDLNNQFKEDPVKAIQQFNTSQNIPDTWIYRIVVGSLGLSVILVIIAVVILTFNKDGSVDKDVPTILTAIASGAIGALAGLLAPSPTGGKTE